MKVMEAVKEGEGLREDAVRNSGAREWRELHLPQALHSLITSLWSP